jgi:hypothetical protein
MEELQRIQRVVVEVENHPISHPKNLKTCMFRNMQVFYVF